MRPTVSRIVHYAGYGTPGGEYVQVCRAAIITEVYVNSPAKQVSLCIVNPESLCFSRGVPYHEGAELKPGEVRSNFCGNRDYADRTWHWPAREPE